MKRKDNFGLAIILIAVIFIAFMYSVSIYILGIKGGIPQIVFAVILAGIIMFLYRLKGKKQ